MEDFLKFLLIAGVILVGIFKEVNKNKKPGKRPVSPMPSSDEIKPDAVPMPEAWSNPKRKKKREEISVAASIANSAAQYTAFHYTHTIPNPSAPVKYSCHIFPTFPQRSPSYHRQALCLSTP